MPSCINGGCGLGPSECQSCSEAEARKQKDPVGREWNDKLIRRLTNSTCKASDRPKVTRLLVTDLTSGCGKETRPTGTVLVEVLGIPDDMTTEQVIAEFLVEAKRVPKVPRYRAERGWPE